MSGHHAWPPRAALAVAIAVAFLPCIAFAQSSSPALESAVSVPVENAQSDAAKVMIREYVVRGNTMLDTRTIEQAVTPYLGPGRTMRDVESARSALQDAYQSKGFQSVYVDLPEQQVSGGVVFLQVTETRIGQVEVIGAKHTDPDLLREQIPALHAGKVPDFDEAQRQLTQVNLSARRQVIPLVKEGSQPGTMDVQLKVEDQSPWRFSASLNNDHSPDTSALRAMLSLTHDNLWQRGHVASLTFFGAPEEMNEANVWSGSYQMPLTRPDLTLEVSGYVSDSDVLTQGNTNVTANGHSVGLKLRSTLPTENSWWQWHQLWVGIDFRDLDERVLMAGQSAQEAPLRYAPISVGYSGFRQGEHHQVGASLQLVFGTRTFLGYGSDTSEFDWRRYRADPSFASLKADLDDTFTAQGGSQLYSRLSMQITDAPMVSAEQMAAGGMYSVRGYRSAEALGDYGVLGTLEWRTPAFGLWGQENWRLYAYADAAWMKLRDPLPEQDDEFSLGSIGVGSSLYIREIFNLRLDYGHPLLDGPITTSGAHRLHFSLGVSF